MLYFLNHNFENNLQQYFIIKHDRLTQLAGHPYFTLGTVPNLIN